VNPLWWDHLFWMLALTGVAIGALLLLPSPLGRLFDGRISASSLAVAFYLIYSIPFAFDYIFSIIGPEDVSIHTVAMLKISFIGMSGLLAGVVIARGIIRRREAQTPAPFEPAHLRRFLWLGGILLVLGWGLIWLGSKPFGGIIAFLSTPYLARLLKMTAGFSFLHYAVIVYMAAGQVGGFLLAGYLRLRRPLREKLLPLLLSAVILLLPALWFALWGQRRGMIVGTLVFLVFFSCYVRRIRFGYAMLALASFYAILVAVSIIRSMTIATYSPEYAKKIFQAEMRTGIMGMFSLSKNDPGLTLIPVGDIYDYQERGGELLWGRSYAVAIAWAIPRPLRFTGERPEGVGRWYTRKFDPEHHARGGVVAVTSTAEALANFGLTGVFLIHLLIMFVFVSFEALVSRGVIGTALLIGSIPFYVLILHHHSNMNLVKLTYVLGLFLFFVFLIYGPGLLRGRGRASPESQVQAGTLPSLATPAE